jgi:hypothetical protein
MRTGIAARRFLPSARRRLAGGAFREGSGICRRYAETVYANSELIFVVWEK